MRDHIQGRPFHGEFTSADASALSEANSRITLYSAGNTPTAITLAANERVVITDLKIIAGAVLTVTIYDGPDNTVDAGERIDLGSYPANGGVYESMNTPHYCQRNNSTSTPRGYPKVKTNDAGQIDVQIRGVIQRDGQ